MRMLRRIKGVRLRDKVKSVDIRKELGVNSTQEEVREMRLRWYGHVQRMEENNEVRVIIVDMIVPGKRPRGRWMDCVQRDMQELRITPEDAQDRTFWKSRIRAADLVGKGKEEEKAQKGHNASLYHLDHPTRAATISRNGASWV